MYKSTNKKKYIIPLFLINNYFNVCCTNNIKNCQKLALKHWKYNGFWVLDSNDSLKLICYLEQKKGVDKTNLIDKLSNMIQNY